jgi:hypothetical protein
MVFAAVDNAGRQYALKRMLAESRDMPLLQAEIDTLVCIGRPWENATSLAWFWHRPLRPRDWSANCY